MKEPKLTTKIVKHWSCDKGNCKAHHRTKNAALKCMNKPKSTVRRLAPTMKEKMDLYEMALDGESIGSIANKTGFNATTVRSKLECVMWAMQVFGKNENPTWLQRYGGSKKDLTRLRALFDRTVESDHSLKRSYLIRSIINERDFKQRPGR